ncbi:acyltransferase [Acidisphaera sp. L21]|jgi:peptidoglycan/LPS O-acetylase OafA/YrhL|uniref:acyltransferase family protein n=1 Tax=Acidisphaera sp. L21 TaxID=1641851 RepID=UPI00131CBFAF|nr:acyltransferase [Acidisphaera sp. L21]
MDQPKLPFIDALRGYAIVLVIASHAFPTLPELPWTMKRFTNLGFFGVQLFFVVSCVTLTRSWRQQQALRGYPSLRDFMIRRLFRIAPAYYLAAALYLWLSWNGLPAATRLATFLTFTNGWSPGQMPTMPDAWIGVPGGWSIEAEVAFYALFPMLMVTIRGFWPALVALLVSLPFAWVANGLGWAAYVQDYGSTATDQFLYYWLPNEMPVFLAGLVLHEVIIKLSPGGQWQLLGVQVSQYARLLLAACVVTFLSLGLIAWPRLPVPGWLFVPSHLVAALAFSGITLAFALRPMPLLVNWAIVRIGQGSFSAYLLHFALLEGIVRLLPASVLGATGINAIAAATALFVAVLVITGVLAQATYRWIETPGIQTGHHVSRVLNGKQWSAKTDPSAAG